MFKNIRALQNTFTVSAADESAESPPVLTLSGCQWPGIQVCVSVNHNHHGRAESMSLGYNCGVLFMMKKIIKKADYNLSSGNSYMVEWLLLNILPHTQMLKQSDVT